MTVSLGGITLDDDLVLTGAQSPQIALSVRRTFGAPVVQRCAVTAGKVLVLHADRDGSDLYGAFTRLQKEQLAALRDAGSSITLVHYLGSWSVIIPPDGINLESVPNHANPGNDEEYIGTVTMITV